MELTLINGFDLSRVSEVDSTRIVENELWSENRMKRLTAIDNFIAVLKD